MLLWASPVTVSGASFVAVFVLHLSLKWLSSPVSYLWPSPLLLCSGLMTTRVLMIPKRVRGPELSPEFESQPVSMAVIITWPLVQHVRKRWQHFPLSRELCQLSWRPRYPPSRVPGFWSPTVVPYSPSIPFHPATAALSHVLVIFRLLFSYFRCLLPTQTSAHRNHPFTAHIWPCRAPTQNSAGLLFPLSSKFELRMTESLDQQFSTFLVSESLYTLKHYWGAHEALFT